MSLERWLPSARRAAPSLALALALAGCAANPSPVPVVAPADAIAALAGEWTGEYSSAATGRSGSILFTLTAGRDTAFGDVVMVPAGSDRALPQEKTGAGSPSVVTRAKPQPLAIRFVRLAGDSVSGMLAPYTAPECGCVLTTTFTGRVGRDRIDGTFTSSGEAHAAEPQVGRWTVTRRRR